VSAADPTPPGYPHTLDIAAIFVHFDADANQRTSMSEYATAQTAAANRAMLR
jgi:hypothetical protein